MKKKKIAPEPENNYPMDEDLPEGWKSVILEDYIYIAARIGWRGLKREEYTKEGPLFLAVKDILENGFIDYNNVTDHLSEFRYDESPEIQLKENDIIITKDGTIGKIGFVKNLPGKVTVNSSLLVVRPSPEILPRFLFHYFRSPSFQKIVRERITGSAVPHLFQKDIKKFRVLVPPLPEQQRIVARIEALISHIDAARDRLNQMPLVMKRFRQGVLAAACSGGLTEGWREENPDVENVVNFIEKLNQEKQAFDKKRIRYLSDPDFSGCHGIPETWGWARLGEISIAVDVDHKMPKAVEKGLPLISPKDFIEPDKINFKDAKKISPEDFDRMCRKIRPEKGDILLSRYGTIGKVRKVPAEPKFQISYSLCLIRPFLELKNNDYLYWILQSLPVYHQALANDKSSSIPDLGIKDINNFTIPLPPLAEQHEIVRHVNALFARADAIDREVAAATKRAEGLTQVVLAKAFRGELVSH